MTSVPGPAASAVPVPVPDLGSAPVSVTDADRLDVYRLAVTAAVLDLLVARGLATADGCQAVRGLLGRVVQMLVKLEQRMAR